jgi:signal transduction histidine kinase
MERDPARARAALAAVQGTGRTAVGELARMLDLLRGTDDQALAPVPTLDRLADLAEEARLAGADVAVDSGPLPPLDPGLQLCAYRVVQEALTNAAKHARQPRVRVRLFVEEGDLVVAVDDDGGSGARTSHGTGHGLVGLRERVEVYGGRLESSALPGGGYRLRAVLPIGVAA